MKRLLLLLAIVFSLNCFSQVGFEKGYFIDHNEYKVACLIKNSNDFNRTKKIKYKDDVDGEIKRVSIDSIREVVIYNTAKFIKRNVEIGLPNKLNERDITYTFKKQELFLNVLVEGRASLYSYYDNGKEVFFFTPNEFEIEQLVFKTYISKNDGIERKNNNYKKQLYDNLSCESIHFKEVNNLDYAKKDLIAFFIKYNDCINSTATVYSKKEKVFNINLRPRVNSTSLVVDEIGGRVNLKSYDFGQKTLMGFGIEVEVLFPFLNDQWTFSIEPTYQGKYSSEIVVNEGLSTINERVFVSYKSFEIPITIRHYLHLTKNSKFFLNASLVPDFSLKSNVITHTALEYTIQTLQPSSSLNFAFGAGYKFKNKYSIEARYYTNRNIINHLIDHTSTYTMFSVIAGYTLF